MLDLIPPQFRLAAYALACALLFASGWIAQGWRLNERIAQMQADSAHDLAEAIAQARSEEQRRQTALEIIRDDANKQISTALSDAAAASATADGLQHELDRIKRKPACNSTASAGGQARPDPTAMLADLLAEVERAGRAMAAEAQRRGIAGRACEASYGALR